jgi:hypothetical protein
MGTTDLRAADRFYSLSTFGNQQDHAGVKTAAQCKIFGGRTAWQEGGDNDPINQLAGNHVDLSISSFVIQEENHFPELLHEILPGTTQLKGGYLCVNDAPGLGIDISETLAAKYPLKMSPSVNKWTNVRAMERSAVMP